MKIQISLHDKKNMPRLAKMRDMPTHIRIINEPKYSNKPKLGDIFAFSIKDGEYMFGRVIVTDFTVGYTSSSEGRQKVIIYLYNLTSVKKNDPEIFQKLTFDKILLHQEITYGYYWQAGFFETVANEPITDDIVHRPLCFKFSIPVPGVQPRYFDEQNNVIEKQEICMSTGVSNIFGINNYILLSLKQGKPFIYCEHQGLEIR